MDRVYKLLQGLRPEFEGIRGQLYNRENPLTFDNAVSQLMTEESCLQEMKGGEESLACAVSQPRVAKTTQPPPQPNANRRGPIRNKDNLWCNYCKRRGHVKETCRKLKNIPPQVHMMTQPGVNQGEISGGQQWAPSYTPSSTYSNTHVTPHHPQDLKIQSLEQQMQSLQEQIQRLQAFTRASTSSRSIIGSTSLANSGKNSIVSALSIISSLKSYQNSWILDS